MLSPRRRQTANIPKEFRLVPPGRDDLSARPTSANRDLDPQLVWRGKDEQDWSDLAVHALPLYIQEKIHPKALIKDLIDTSDDLAKKKAIETVDSSTCSPTSTSARWSRENRFLPTRGQLDESDDPWRQPTGHARW